MTCMLCMIGATAWIMQNMHPLKTMQTMHFMHPGRGVREKPAEIAG